MGKLIIIFLIFLNILIASNNSTITKATINNKQQTSSLELKIKEILYKEILAKDKEQISSNINLLIWVFTAFMTVLMFYGIIVEAKKFRDKNIIDNVAQTVNSKYEEVAIKFNDKFKDQEENLNVLVRENIDVKIKGFYKELKKIEKIKNNVLYSLNKWLQEKIQHENKDDAYIWYNERFFIINKLVYGNEKDIKRVLVELQVSVEMDLLKLPSFKKLLKEIGKKDIELDTLVQELLNSEI